jgi:2-polyprenyl-3-methyl-5-hydroxy-6-metoxy-1,4-benzoquinol methylase
MIQEPCPICRKNNIKIKKFDGIKDPYDSVEGKFFFNKCLNCENLYIGNPLSKDKIEKAYSKNYGAYKKMSFDKIRNHLIEKKVKRLLKNFPRKKVKVLEIGAGEGIYAKYFKKYGHESIATDIDEESMKRLSDVGIKTKVGDFQSIKFKDKFDIIIMSHVIEHFYNPKKIVKKLKGLLTENGIVYLKTPNSDFLFLDKLKNHTYVFDAPRHINIFSKKSLGYLFKEAGFRINIKDEFTLNEFINYFKLKYKIKKYHLPFILCLAIVPSIIAYLTKRSSRMILFYFIF